nr:hypothetical protein CFP56_68154 [Quercus suber]
MHSTSDFQSSRFEHSRTTPGNQARTSQSGDNSTQYTRPSDGFWNPKSEHLHPRTSQSGVNLTQYIRPSDTFWSPEVLKLVVRSLHLLKLPALRGCRPSTKRVALNISCNDNPRAQDLTVSTSSSS